MFFQNFPSSTDVETGCQGHISPHSGASPWAEGPGAGSSVLQARLCSAEPVTPHASVSCRRVAVRAPGLRSP